MLLDRRKVALRSEDELDEQIPHFIEAEKEDPFLL